MEARLSLDTLQKNNVLDIKLTPQNRQQLVDLDLYNDQDDEGEIMLLAMILLQLHGVKLPEDDNDLLNKKKRQRTSPDQLAILEQIFQTDKMPNQQTRVHLADQLGMSSRRVQIWFQNKRQSMRQTSRQAANPATGGSHQPFSMSSQSENVAHASYGSLSPTTLPAQSFVQRSDSRPVGGPDARAPPQPRREDDSRKWSSGRY